MDVNLDERQIATIEAALRYWMLHFQRIGKPSRRKGMTDEIAAIATGHGQFPAFRPHEIAALIVHLRR